MPWPSDNFQSEEQEASDAEARRLFEQDYKPELGVNISSGTCRSCGSKDLWYDCTWYGCNTCHKMWPN